MNKILLCIIVCCFILFNLGSVQADEVDRKVLIIYSSHSNDLNQIKILETLIGHFSTKVTVLSQNEINSFSNLQDYSYLIYFGLSKQKISSELTMFVEEFKGNVMAIGENINYFPRFSFVHVKDEVIIKSISVKVKKISKELPEERIINLITANNPSIKVLLEGTTNNNEKVPLLVSSYRTYYFASKSLYNPIGLFLGESLFNFFQETAIPLNLKYIRLEDIHPKTDPENLKKFAEYLYSKNIPYMVAVIPVYTEGSEIIQLSEKPRLVKVLKYMQDHGGSIILHGYKHQYRDSETGEGFEFWDVENDRPILQKKNEKPMFEKDFNSLLEFNNYIQEKKAFEKKYIEKAVEQGVQELVAHKLYPLAFEAPHYAMSKEGYKIIANHFSTYIGQVQISNTTWRTIYAPLYKSQPKFLKGMVLLPETIGFAKEEDPNAIIKMEEKAEFYSLFSNAYISGFYHPYLGLKDFKKLITFLEDIPNTKWLDLKSISNSVSVKGITIMTENNKIIVEKDLISSDYEKNLLLIQVMKWIAIFIIAVVICSSIINDRKKRVKITVSTTK
ncbi:uncharacterized protein YdaL [Fictibacillus halophilus]|uniref:Uncharacterized protein YdaL n=1 Tax=Fictibacillus halophilus TaxID=1610490 RepID=A0ABV2LHD5_9BACL|nr:polysaccharide deacetylase family protein [Fictibacillus halophilus]